MKAPLSSLPTLVLAAAWVAGIPSAARALVPGATYASVVDTTTPAPGQTTNFSGLSAPVLRGSNLTFRATYSSNTGVGIYTGAVGTAGAVRVADYSTTAPGQTANFFDIGSSFLSGRNVAFNGLYDTGQGIYTGTVGTAGAARVADYTTAVPGQTTAFSSFSDPAISGNTVAFQATYNSNGGQGVYTAMAGTTGAVKIADGNTAFPGQANPFVSFGTPAISGSTVVFSGSTVAAGVSYAGIYTGTAGTAGVVKLVDTTSTAPGQTTAINRFSGIPAISGNTVAFQASYNSDAGQGIYTGTAGATGAARIADFTTPVPGQTTAFFGFGAPALSGNNVLFRGSYNSNRGAGLYLGVAGMTGVTRVVDYSTTVPKQGNATFSGFSTFSLSDLRVAFVGSYSGGSGIFLLLDGSLLDVAETGEPLFGSTISSLSLNAYGLDGDTLAYGYTLASGVRGVGTFVIPEPSRGAWFAAAAAGLGVVARRRYR